MADFKIYITGNYINIEDVDNGNLIDFPAKDIVIEKANESSTAYNINYLGKPLPFLKGIDISRIKKEDGSDYTVSTFQTFYRFNTGGEVARSYESELANGYLPDKSVVNKWGQNTNLDNTGNFHLVSSWGATFDPTTDVIQTAQSVTISYNNTTDGAGTTGADQLLIEYLDENDDLQTAVHVMGITGFEVSSFDCKGINRALVFNNNGIGSNVNDITFTATIDGTIQAQIPAGRSVTQQLLYHTPKGTKLNTDFLFLNANKDTGGGGSPTVEFEIWSWSRVTQTKYFVFDYKFDTADVDGRVFNTTQKFPFGGREVIYCLAKTTVNNTVVNARMSGELNKLIN